MRNLCFTHTETPTPKPFSHQVYKDLQREDRTTLKRHQVSVDSLVAGQSPHPPTSSLQGPDDRAHPPSPAV